MNGCIYFSALLCALLLLADRALVTNAYKDVPCEWKSSAGAFFDMKALIIPKKEPSYYIKDGDIPCTPEHEMAYSFVWNICGEVTQSSLPDVCHDKGVSGAAIQYQIRDDGFHICEVLGHYDSSHDDMAYKLLDSQNPALGVSIKYAAGARCEEVPSVQRTATIDMVCANVDTPVIVSALEPSKCQYHMVMKTSHGCPKSCPITSDGLCNSHGYCGWDKRAKKAYCFCNEGYGGDSCLANDSSEEYDGYSVQMGMMSVLLIVTIALVGVVGVMLYRITNYRKEDMFSFLPGSLGSSLGGGSPTIGSRTFNPLGANMDDDDEGADVPGAMELSSFDKFDRTAF